jgi:hypothetical protein
MKNIYTGFSFTFELSTSKYVNAIMEDPLIPHLSKCMFFAKIRCTVLILCVEKHFSMGCQVNNFPSLLEKNVKSALSGKTKALLEI